jgi:hypothetical protein
MEKHKIEVYIPHERGEVVRRVGTNPRALREMVIQGEVVGAERLRARLGQKG